MNNLNIITIYITRQNPGNETYGVRSTDNMDNAFAFLTKLPKLTNSRIPVLLVTRTRMLVRPGLINKAYLKYVM